MPSFIRTETSGGIATVTIAVWLVPLVAALWSMRRSGRSEPGSA
jgi:hypothetical protein